MFKNGPGEFLTLTCTITRKKLINYMDFLNLVAWILPEPWICLSFSIQLWKFPTIYESENCLYSKQKVN